MFYFLFFHEFATAKFPDFYIFFTLNNDNDETNIFCVELLFLP